MEILPLTFSGHRWPAARISGRKELLRDSQSSVDLRTVTVATIVTSGNGRKWTADEPRGFWRTFAEINHEDDKAVVDFVRRYGDPAGELTPDSPVHTGYWYQLMTILALFRNAWSGPDHDGISYTLKYPNEFGGLSVEQADLVVKQTNVSLVIDAKLRLSAQCDRLDQYMVMSAAFMLARRTAMRSCDHCGHWFGLKRRSARFCSTECRSAVFRLDKETIDDGIGA